MISKQFPRFFLCLALLCGAVFGQSAYTTTTLSSGLTARSSVSVNLASTTNVFGPSQPISQGGIGSPTSPAAFTLLYIDKELMRVMEAPSGNMVRVERGYSGTAATAHNANATVYVGPPSWFFPIDPSGACVASSQPVLPKIAYNSGNFWTCPTSGPNTNVWTRSNAVDTFTFTDGSFYLPPGACYSTVSGNPTGTNGYTTVGASNTPVIQAQTSNSGTNSHTYICAIQAPSRLTTGKGAQITDVTFFYGVQSSNLGTQSATLASGTFNGSTVFSYVNFPAAAASETASTVTPVRLDAGSLAITPVAASFNTSITTTGAFYSAKFTPAAPIPLNTDLRTVLLTVTLQCAATTGTVTNSPGLLVHYSLSPL